MTGLEIRSCELAYQIRLYLASQKKNEEQFSKLSGVSLQELTLLLQDKAPELSVSRLTKICDVLSITLDSLAYGPIKEKRFIQLIRRCVFANDLKGTPLYIPYIKYLKKWQERKIEPACLKRYTKWFMYFCSTDEDEKPKRTDTIPYKLSSAVCFTRKISPEQKCQLERIIEESKRK